MLLCCVSFFDADDDADADDDGDDDANTDAGSTCACQLVAEAVNRVTWKKL